MALVQPFYDEHFSLPLVMSGAAVLCLSFLGFDAVSTMAEETPEPRRQIPAAIMLVTLIGGVLSLLKVVDRKGYPFGPFMLVGALVGVVVGQPLIDAIYS